MEEARATTAEAQAISQGTARTPKRGKEKNEKAKGSKECATRAERWGIQPESAQKEKEKGKESRREKEFGKSTTLEKTGTGKKKAKRKQER